VFESRFKIGDIFATKAATRRVAAGIDQQAHWKTVAEITFAERGTIITAARSLQEFLEDEILHQSEAQEYAVKFLAERMQDIATRGFKPAGVPTHAS